MIELFLCSLLTVFPDYLFRTRVQGKRWGEEITFFSMWYELRWGLTACFMLTVTLVTIIFYHHPMSTSVTSFFRTVTILTESGGRVTEVHVQSDQRVSAGDPLFAVDASEERSAVETLKRRIDELDAQLSVGQADLAAAEGQIEQAEGSLKQAQDELNRTLDLQQRNADVVAQREVDRLTNSVASREGALNAAEAQRDAVRGRLEVQLPAERASAEAQLEEAEVRLAKTVVYAGTDGVIEQFDLRPGDIVSPLLRPAGILVPDSDYQRRFQAGFGQVSAQIVKVGMVAEMTCFSKPFTIIPMVVTRVQDVIAAGQFRPTDALRDVTEADRPGTVRATLEPLYEGGAEGIPRGSRCIAAVYTSFHEALETEDLGLGTWLFYHMVDATAVVHAAGLRIRAMLFPIQTLVFSGH